MSPYFTINFRREAYQREVARTRRRLLTLGAWLAYFGVLGIVIGLYGLNCEAVMRRAGQMERQVTRLKAQGDRRDWQVRADQIATIERFKQNPAAWRHRLERLAALLPANATLISVAVNPENTSNAAEQRKLVITGEFRTAPGTDRMRPAVQLVSTLRSDSAFAREYSTIRLASSQTMGEAANVTAFVIECR